MSILSRLPLPTHSDPKALFDLHISTIFLEHKKQILLLKRNATQLLTDRWQIPEARGYQEGCPLKRILDKLKEELQIELSRREVVCYGQRSGEMYGPDVVFHLFQVEMKKAPPIQIGPHQHLAYKWVSLYTFQSTSSCLIQKELFGDVYRNRIWQIIPRKPVCLEYVEREIKTFFMRKGERILSFNGQRRLVFTLNGTPSSGKRKQGDALSGLFHLPMISAGRLLKNALDLQRRFGWMNQGGQGEELLFRLLDETLIGILGTRLAKEDCSRGFILHGFPKTAQQAEVFAKIFLRPNDLHIPIFIEVAEKKIVQTFRKRLICSDCNHPFRILKTGSLAVHTLCSPLSQLEVHTKADINELNHRLKRFKENRNQVLSVMRQSSVLEIDGTTTTQDAIFHHICEWAQKRFNTIARQ